MTKKRWEIILALVAISTLIVAGLRGFVREAGNVEHEIASILPDGKLAEPGEEGRFIVLSEGSLNPAGYIAIETGEGFGGDMVMAVLVDTTGKVQGLEILRHNETPSSSPRY